MGCSFASSTAKNRKILQRIIDVLFKADGELSTVEIAAAMNLDPGVIGSILAKSEWATRRRRVRINRNRVETRWAASDAAMIDYARRNARCLVRKASELAAKGVEFQTDHQGRVKLRCGSVTTIVHTD